MKKELQDKLVEILTSIQTAAGKASDFAMEQLPDIAQQYVTYGRVSLTLFVLIGAVMSIAASVLAVRAARSRDPEVVFVNGMGVIFIGLPGVLIFGHTISDMLMVWVAPKVWLLKEIAGMIR